jgi:hypothetical protein
MLQFFGLFGRVGRQLTNATEVLHPCCAWLKKTVLLYIGAIVTTQLSGLLEESGGALALVVL